MQTDNKVLCKICPKYTFGMLLIARGSAKKHLESLAHKEAEVAFWIDDTDDNAAINDGQIPLFQHEDDEYPENFCPSPELQPVDVPENTLGTTSPSVSALVQRLIQSILLSDNNFTDDPFFNIARALKDNNNADAPTSWNDRQFIAEMGFGKVGVIREDGVDNSMSNLLQRFSKRHHSSFIAFLYWRPSF